MKNIKIAIQKSGRLNEDSLALLKECGIQIDTSKQVLKATASNFNLDVLFLRNDDIPNYLDDGVVDIAILGENTIWEKQKSFNVIQKLGFSKCRVSIATPKGIPYNGLQDLKGKRIATSYTNTLQNYLNKNNINAEIHEISGSVEIAPNIGLADAIMDIVSSGGTLFNNGLVEREVVLRSEAVLVARKDLDNELNQLLQTLIFRVNSVLEARKFKYILLNAPNDKIEEITNILPVLKSPTVLPLAMEGWSSLHSVIEKDKFWEILEKLKKAGAEGILVVPIEKMVL